MEAAENFTVSLSNLVAATVPVGSIDISDTASATITDNDTAAISIDDVTVTEDGMLTFAATLNSDVDGGLTVDAVFSDATASAADYDGTTQTLAFAGTAGETQTFTVPLTDDSLVESAEDFTVALDNLLTAVVPVGSIDITDLSLIHISEPTRPY